MKKDKTFIIIAISMTILLLSMTFNDIYQKWKYEKIINDYTELIAKRDSNIIIDNKYDEGRYDNVMYWYEITLGHVVIDYPLFLKYEDRNIEDILKNYKESGFDDSVIIENINWTDFDFLLKLNSKIYFKYYDFKFSNYENDYYKILDKINNEKWLVEVDLYFECDLTNKSLKSILNKIIEISANWMPYFDIWIKEEFMDSYSLSKEELDTIHSLADSEYDIIWIRMKIDESISDKYILDFVKREEVDEYGLYWSYSKFNWEIHFKWKLIE